MIPTIFQKEHKVGSPQPPISGQLSTVSFNWSWKTEGFKKAKKLSLGFK